MRARSKKFYRCPLMVSDFEEIVSNHADNIIHFITQRPHRFVVRYAHFVRTHHEWRTIYPEPGRRTLRAGYD
jgi:hypothetical protein